MSANSTAETLDGFCKDSRDDSIFEKDPSLEFHQKQALDWFAYVILGPVIVAIGIVGNVLNLIVLTRPSLKGVTYTYLTGLACSDLGVLLCAVPMMVRQIRVDEGWSWPISFFYGHLELPLSNQFMASSIFIVVCLTVDRFISVCLPTKFNSVHTTYNARAAIISCYTVAFIVSVPLAALKKMCRVPAADFNYPLYRFVENEQVTHALVWRIYTISEATLVRFGPGFVLAVLNILIIRRFREITKKRRELRLGVLEVGSTDQFFLRGERISKRIYKEEKRLVILLTVIVLLFFVTMTPVAFLGIFYTEKLDRNFAFQIFRAAANNLELCNFALNFCVYFLCSKEFRKKFLSFFVVLIPKKANNDHESITLPEAQQHRASRIPVTKV